MARRRVRHAAHQAAQAPLARCLPGATQTGSAIVSLSGMGELRFLDLLSDRLSVPCVFWPELIDKLGAADPEALVALQSVALLRAPTTHSVAGRVAGCPSVLVRPHVGRVSPG